jgi:hypothetical protein
VSVLSSYIVGFTREQITESEYARLVAAERTQMLPLAVTAEWLGEETDEWEDMLAELFHDGTIAGRCEGRGIELNLGSFYDWRGKPVPVCPEWATAYEIVPDDRAEHVRRENAAREDARRMVQRTLTCSVGHDLDGLQDAAVETGVFLAEACDLRAVEGLVEESRLRLHGEDPLDPAVRESLNYCRAEFARLGAIVGAGDSDFGANR